MIKCNKSWIKIFSISLPVVVIASSAILINTKINYQTNDNVILSTKTYSNYSSKQIELYQNAKFNILLLDNSYDQISAIEFYTNQALFNNLQNLIKDNINEFIANFDANTMQINTISINKINDDEEILYNGVKISGREKKEINGQLAIDIVVNDKNANEAGTSQNYSFILCGFKRNHGCIMNSNNIYNQLSSALTNGISINQTFNNQSAYKTFLQTNLFYYQDYSDPNNSNFTNIPSSAIIAKNLYQYEINIEKLNGSIFNNNGTKITKNLIFNFVQPQTTVWTPLIVIIIVIIGLALLIGIIIFIWWLKQHTKKIKVEDWRW